MFLFTLEIPSTSCAMFKATLQTGPWTYSGHHHSQKDLSNSQFNRDVNSYPQGILTWYSPPLFLHPPVSQQVHEMYWAPTKLTVKNVQNEWRCGSFIHLCSRSLCTAQNP